MCPPPAGEREVVEAGPEADLAAVPLEGGARHDVDRAAQRVAVLVRRGGLDHLDVRDAVGDEIARAESAGTEAVAVELEGIELAGEPADVHSLGRAVLALVDGESRQTLERVADVAVIHRPEGLLRDDVHDTAGGLLLIDRERLAARRLRHLEGGHPEHLALQIGVQHGRGARGHHDRSAEGVETDVLHLDRHVPGGHAGEGVAAVGVRRVHHGGAGGPHDGALQRATGGALVNAAGDDTGDGLRHDREKKDLGGEKAENQPKPGMDGTWEHGVAGLPKIGGGERKSQGPDHRLEEQVDRARGRRRVASVRTAGFAP